MREMLFDFRRTAAAASMEAAHHKSPAHCRLLDVKAVDIELVVVFSVGDRRLQHLFDVLRDTPARKGELGERGLSCLATDHRRDEVELLRADAQRPQKGRSLIVGESARSGLLSHRSSPQVRRARLSPEWP